MGCDRMCFAVNAEDANDAGNPLDKTPQMVLQKWKCGIGTTIVQNSKYQWGKTFGRRAQQYRLSYVN